VNTLFVNYHDFTSNSAVHIFNLAKELDRLGVACAVCVPDNKESVEGLGEASFRVFEFDEARAEGVSFADGGGPTLIHAWTPRENVRLLTEELVLRYGCPYVVHLEDNEDLITANQLGIPVEVLRSMSPETLNGNVPQTLSHPHRSRDFLARSSGVTVIIDRLLEFKPDSLPGEVIWPGLDSDLLAPRPRDAPLRRELGINDDEFVAVYHGNSHPTNMREMRSLYLAVAALNRRRFPLRLVRLGRDYVDFLGDELSIVNDHVVSQGFVPRAELGRYLSLADVLVQPGRSDPFNDYRLPGKLPEFLSTGRPVVLPASNIGRYLHDGEDCILLRKGHALEIACSVERLLENPLLRERIGERGRIFAQQNFSWPRSAGKLKHFYELVLHRLSAQTPEDTLILERLGRRYQSFAPPELSYATVADYCDSADHLPALAMISQDMKDVQRPWVFKAVLGTLRRGSTLLEIGAGQPIVADLLARLGYDVWVIDPYDGRDGGPADPDAMRATYPRVRIVEGVFPTDLDTGAISTFDGIYSISVLEHVSIEQIDEVCSGIRQFLKPGGVTIHAIDHVLQGNGDAVHRARLKRIVSGLNLDTRDLDELLVRLAGDVETYFLSAESHNRWRGPRPYNEFPMRRCISIQACVRTDERQTQPTA
jgi:glycosyltransferase involved in cell wall biosynthesis/2-polyprenyl-3-methyl-5-hydroxy-6-metoxy-1,4-benzoquinol methylase